MTALSELKYDEQGLVTVVVQDRMSGEIRMLAHADHGALQATLESGLAHFYSRSRATRWRKGETSGHVLHVAEVWADCDGDALVYLVDASGPSCHTERQTCFFRRVRDDAVEEDPEAHARPALPRLWAELEARTQRAAHESYTKQLLSQGADVIGDKLREEADELARAIATESDDRVVAEAADVVYHLLVGLLSRGTTLRELETELARRFGISGLAEKAARKATEKP
jgi:phosphoribosyl-ATP pyrophosphohydrolase/phosphoribosyl-AMP cyclohydrolase